MTLKDMKIFLKEIIDFNTRELYSVINKKDFKDIYMLGNLYQNQLSIEYRKTQGQFYTPKDIINRVIDYSLKAINIVENPNIKILDPACGSGFFLYAAYDYLMKSFKGAIEELKAKYCNQNYFIEKEGKSIKLTGEEYWKEENLHYHILKNCIYGADIDKKAVQLCKLNLISLKEEVILKELNIICCDSLIKYELEASKKANKICEFWENKFDIIIGNPPWVSFSRRYKKTIEEDKFKYYLENYESNRYNPNLCEFFLLRSFDLLAAKGRIGFVLPDRIAFNCNYEKLRVKIEKNFKILKVDLDLNFPKIVTDPMILVIEKNKPYKDFQYFIKKSNSNGYIEEKLFENSYALSTIAKTFTGFIGSKNKITEQKEKENQERILKGKNIKEFQIKNHMYFELEKENIIGGTRDLELLKKKNKLVIRKTGKDLIAAIDKEGIAIEQSLYGIVLKTNELSENYLLSLLNSNLINWYYKNFLVTNKHSTPQIKKVHLDKIPIKIPTIKKLASIEEKVNMVLNNSKEDKYKNIISYLKLKIEEDILEIYGLKDIFDEIQA